MHNATIYSHNDHIVYSGSFPNAETAREELTARGFHRRDDITDVEAWRKPSTAREVGSRAIVREVPGGVPMVPFADNAQER